MSNAYVIYYGWLTSDEDGEPDPIAHEIAAAGIPLLIAHFQTAAPDAHRNISAKVLSLMHGAGTQVYAYVATSWGNTDLNDVEREVAEYLAGGVDGIFFDEANALIGDDKLPYYQRLAHRVRDAGKTVILNAGVSRCGEKIMQVADRVMVEHAWRNLAAHSLWKFRYAADRFMGVSSNEQNAMGYVVDEQRAIADTREAWKSGIGWHTSTNVYIELPDWFADYVQAVKADG